MRLFGPNLPTKGSYFQSKTDKIDTTIEFCIFELVFVSNFTLNKQFWIFGPNLPKKDMVKNRKIEHHHWIPLIQISLGTKFQLKLTILIFLTRFTQKGFSWSKTEKVNTTYFFYIILHIQISLVGNFRWNWQFLSFGSNLHKNVFSVKNWKR